jgi:hypothetical protein
MRELRQRLAEVVATRFGGVERRASLAAGLNENQVGSILKNPNKLPTVETLDKLALAYGWDLCDVIHWTLGKERPVLEEQAAATLIAQALARAGYREEDRGIIRDMVRRLAPSSVEASNNASS